MYTKGLFLVVLAFMAVGCGRLDMKGMFFSGGSHTEDRVAGWLDWNAQHEATVIEDAPDQYRVYVCSDPHLSDSTSHVERFLSAEYADPEALFGFINGDLANEGGERPFRLLDSLLHLPTAADTCFVTLGNHDIYFDCEQYYRKYFHTSTYAVTVKTVGGAKDLFLFLDSGNATHGRRQLDWLKDLLSHRDEYRRVVVGTHTCLFRTTYNYSTTPAASLPEEECYELLDLMHRHRVSLFLMGHFHHRETHLIGGVHYVMTDNLNEKKDPPSYLVVTLGSEVEYEYQELYPLYPFV